MIGLWRRWDWEWPLGRVCVRAHHVRVVGKSQMLGATSALARRSQPLRWPSAAVPIRYI